MDRFRFATDAVVLSENAIVANADTKKKNKRKEISHFNRFELACGMCVYTVEGRRRSDCRYEFTIYSSIQLLLGLFLRRCHFHIGRYTLFISMRDEIISEAPETHLD